MHVSRRHVVHQGPVIATILRTAGLAMQRKAGIQPAPLSTPGPVLTKTVPPRSAALVKDYIRYVGGDRAWYKGVVPAHLFPQWGFPLQAQTLTDIPYDLTRVLNGGCRLEINGPLPAREALQLEACLEGIDDNGSRAVIHSRITTSTKSSPNAIEAHLYAIVPLAKKKKGGKKKERPRVPAHAREIGRFEVGRTAIDFALLTGDFNPVHWVPAYAKAAGFRNCINHGFSTMAFAIETLNRNVFAGDVGLLKTIDIKFTRPLILPAKPGVYIDGDGGLFVGDAPGGPAYLTGEYTT